MTVPKTLKDALEVIEHQQKDCSEAREQATAEYRRRLKAEEAAQLAEKHFADLKERLFNADIELSRLRGYLARVHEDDVVRDGMIEIEDSNGKRQVPRRQPPFTNLAYRDDAGMGLSSLYHNSEKRTHWTSY